MNVLNVYVSSQMTSNPGMMTPGGIVVDHKGIIKERYSWEAGHGTNMLVELLGVEQGLRLSCNHQPVAIIVYSANLPIIEQLRGTISTRAQSLAGVHSRITELLRDLAIPIQFQWIPKDGLNTWTGYLQKGTKQRGLFCAQ